MSTSKQNVIYTHIQRMANSVIKRSKSLIHSMKNLNVMPSMENPQKSLHTDTTVVARA